MVIKIMETNLKKFTVKEGDTLYYLGMEIIRNRENRTIKVTQQAYVIEMLKTYLPSNKKISPFPINIKNIEKSSLVKCKEPNPEDIFHDIPRYGFI
jgi:hypothetical protein